MEILPSGKFRYRADLGKARAAEMGVARISGAAKSTPREALASYREALRRALAASKHPPAPPIPTTGDYVWLTLDGPYRERMGTGAMARNTWELYEMIYRTQIDRDPIAEIPLDQLTSEDVEQWIRGLVKTTKRRRRDERGRPMFGPAGEPLYDVTRSPLPPSSKRRYAVFLSGVCERARRAKLIVHNPVHDAEKPSEPETDFRILTRSEVVELLAVADAYSARHYGERPRFSASLAAWMPHRARLVVLLGLHGLGVAEMAGLRVSHFDAKGFSVEWQAEGGELRRRLKTAARRAWVPADPALLREVAALRPLVGRDGFVIPNASGTPVRDDRLQAMFRAMVKGTEFVGLVPYDLRHTFAMRLLEEGVDVRTAAEMMRHSPEVFLKRYVRSRPDLKVQAIARLRYEDREGLPPTSPPTETKRSARKLSA